MSHARAGLEQALKETGLKKKDLADKLGVSTITVSRWVNGHQDPRPLQLQELCDLLNKSPADLGFAPTQSEKGTFAGGNALAPQPPAAQPGQVRPPASGQRTRARMPAGRKWLIGLVALLALLGGTGGAFWWFMTARNLALIDLRAANVAGWVIARQWASGEPKSLVVVDLRTGAAQSLWSTSQDAPSNETPTLEERFVSAFSPAYSPVKKLLAFIAQDYSIWIMPLQTHPGRLPGADAADLRELAADCGGCSTLAWTPDGNWLLYNSPSGLMALSVNSLARRQITQTANDGWPACSPDGKWLAYQQAKMNIVVVPGVNCFPDHNAAGAARYLERYNYSWRPSWSANGQLLSFVSDRNGQSAIYVIPFSQLAQHPQFDSPALATAISTGGCTDPVWAQRTAPAEAAIVYACDAPTSADHHGTLVETAGSTHPGWEALLQEGILVRDSLCWIPPTA